MAPIRTFDWRRAEAGRSLTVRKIGPSRRLSSKEIHAQRTAGFFVVRRTGRVESARERAAHTALEHFRSADWATKLLGEDVKGRYADLKQAAADRCPRRLGTFVKAPEVQYHHEIYNQFLWNQF